MPISLNVNGEIRAVNAKPMTPLATVLREELFLTGTKISCGEGFCGACTVLLDSAPVVSCLVPIASVGEREVRTVESLAPGDSSLSKLQQAFKDEDAVQCGMCFPGILMSLTGAMEDCSGCTSSAPEEEIEGCVRKSLVGNICRCTGYESIVAAATTAVTTEEINK